MDQFGPVSLAELKQAIRDAKNAIRPLMSTQEIKIYQLTDVVDKAVNVTWSTQYLVTTYQKLFITQAALCELALELDLEEEGACLVLTPVGAMLCVDDDLSTSSLSRDLVEQEHLSQPNFCFFLNYENFFSATEASVSSLLERFWRRFDSHMSIEPALATLGLDDKASWKEIQHRFKQLAAEHHPDRGGDSETFIALRQAYEDLRLSRKSR